MGTTLIFLASGKVEMKYSCLDKIRRRGKGKGNRSSISSMRRRDFFEGRNVSVSRGRGVG